MQQAERGTTAGASRPGHAALLFPYDGLILAEAALLGCSMLLTSDDHLRSMDFARLAFELQAFHARVPVIATPREIVRKFFA